MRRYLLWLGPRLTYANVMATAAMFAVLAGGGAYAATKIGAGEIARNAVRGKHIKPLQIKQRHLARKAVKTRHVEDGAITPRKLAPGLVGGPGPAGPVGPTGPPGAPAFVAECGQGLPPDDVMVKVGPVCVDKYEATLWDAPEGGRQLESAAEIDAACPENGQPKGEADCEDFYARSVAGVEPVHRVTWFQAQQALVNSGKRLPTNSEWQMAVSGTPDSHVACNVSSGSIVPTGERPACVSRHGVRDMIGNVAEWVADWDEVAGACTRWSSDFGSDLSCMGHDTPSYMTGALVRGGRVLAGNGATSGPFTLQATSTPSESPAFVGFRGAR